jgi:gas vesicle protein
MFKGKAGFMAGFAAGYVLGAKAGRERYEQIKDATKAFSENPGVQRLANEVQRTVNMTKDRASTAASRTVESAGTQLADKTGKAREFVNTKVGKGSSTSDDDVTTPTTPSTAPTTTTTPGTSTANAGKR